MKLVFSAVVFELVGIRLPPGMPTLSHPGLIILWQAGNARLFIGDPQVITSVGPYAIDRFLQIEEDICVWSDKRNGKRRGSVTKVHAIEFDLPAVWPSVHAGEKVIIGILEPSAGFGDGDDMPTLPNQINFHEVAIPSKKLGLL